MALAAAALGFGMPGDQMQIELGPAARGHIAVVVHGIPGTGPVWLHLAGGTNAKGEAHRWARLRSSPTGWRGVVPVPVLVGVYPVVVRRDHRRYTRAAWIVRVFPRAAAATGRTFADPRAAAEAWVAHLPGSQVLVAERSWKATALDRRDRRLNAMLVIAYAPRGSTGQDNRRGIFLTLARDRVGGRWRVLQASVAPYG